MFQLLFSVIGLRWNRFHGGKLFHEEVDIVHRLIWFGVWLWVLIMLHAGAMVAPGSETIIEDFFTHEGDHPQRYPVQLKDVYWHEIVSALVRADYGIVMGYLDPEHGNVVPNPPSSNLITTEALIVLVRETAEPDPQQVEQCLIEIPSHTRELSTGNV